MRRQAEAGIDVVADGEMGRYGFIPYVNERLTGLEPRSNPASEGTWARSREHLAFPRILRLGGADARSGRRCAAEPMGMHRPDCL